MGLSWGKLEEILNSKKSLRPSGEEAAHPTNVLLQIILPIVLILGVVVFTKIQVLDRLIEEVSRRPFYELYDEAYLELQKQILIRVLERIKSEEREYLGIDLLSGKIEEASNKFVSNRLVDGDFKGICKRTYDRLRQRSRKEEVNHLYDAVLKTTHEELKRVEREKNCHFVK